MIWCVFPGPCDGHECGNDGMECVVNQSSEMEYADCECPSCKGGGKDPVCGFIGNTSQTFSNLCRFQRRACKLNASFEFISQGPCTGMYIYRVDVTSVCVTQITAHVMVIGDGQRERLDIIFEYILIQISTSHRTCVIMLMCYDDQLMCNIVL